MCFPRGGRCRAHLIVRRVDCGGLDGDDMGKRKTRRRFDEPRCGVSQLMVEAEARELERELDSYLDQSLTELKERSAERLRLYREADATLRAAVGRMPERERLAVMCMLARDLHLVL